VYRVFLSSRVWNLGNPGKLIKTGGSSTTDGGIDACYQASVGRNLKGEGGKKETTRYGPAKAGALHRKRDSINGIRTLQNWGGKKGPRVNGWNRRDDWTGKYRRTRGRTEEKCLRDRPGARVREKRKERS